MAELSKHVPIIPVIMKADTMTIHEAQRFRQEVVNRLQNPGGGAGSNQEGLGRGYRGGAEAAGCWGSGHSAYVIADMQLPIL